MRTAIIITCGFLLWGACFIAARLISAASSSASVNAVIAFAGIWFVVAAANLWVGVTKAGYAFAEELPIFLGIFLLPTAVAAFITWKWL